MKMRRNLEKITSIEKVSMWDMHVKMHVFVCNYSLRIYIEATVMKLKRLRMILLKNNYLKYLTYILHEINEETFSLTFCLVVFLRAI